MKHVIGFAKRSMKACLETQIIVDDDGLGAIWDAFTALSQTRAQTGAGISPITFGEVSAYSQLMNVPLQPQHVEALMAMDRVYMNHVVEPAKPPEMSADAFDSLAVGATRT